eukprot:gene4109-14212_t
MAGCGCQASSFALMYQSPNYDVMCSTEAVIVEESTTHRLRPWTGNNPTSACGSVGASQARPVAAYVCKAAGLLYYYPPSDYPPTDYPPLADYPTINLPPPQDNPPLADYPPSQYTPPPVYGDYSPPVYGGDYPPVDAPPSYDYPPGYTPPSYDYPPAETAASYEDYPPGYTPPPYDYPPGYTPPPYDYPPGYTPPPYDYPPSK